MSSKIKSKSRFKEVLKGALLLVPILIAVFIVSRLSQSKKEPDRSALQERTQTVRIIPVEPLKVVPRILGYGYVEPEKNWDAVPQVGGKIIEIHECLKQGMFCEEGDVILRIDPADYDLAIAQQEANIENIKAQIAELDAKEENYNVSLDLEQKSLQAQVLIPIATTIVFGMMASTVLVLLVIPALYTILSDFGLVRKIEQVELVA